MPFITVEDELVKKSVTDVGNKFITRYLPELDAMAVKVYLFALYICQNGQNFYTPEDFAKKLNLTEDELKKYFEYLDEFELIAITSYAPFEIKILDTDNLSGKPKRLHPEKYEGLYEEIQALLAGRMVSQNEFRDYLVLLEDYSFERNALVMIVSYCVNLKGDKISPAYIKKVAESFEREGCTTLAKVEEKLSSYTNATAALIRLFAAMGIKRQPAVEDGELVTVNTGDLLDGKVLEEDFVVLELRQDGTAVLTVTDLVEDVSAGTWKALSGNSALISVGTMEQTVEMKWDGFVFQMGEWTVTFTLPVPSASAAGVSVGVSSCPSSVSCSVRVTYVPST